MGATEKARAGRGSVLLAVILGVVPVLLPIGLSYFIAPGFMMSLAMPLTGAVVAAAALLYVSRVVVPWLRRSTSTPSLEEIPLGLVEEDQEDQDIGLL